MQKAKQPGPYQHTADAPQKHMTGEFSHGVGLNPEPDRLKAAGG